MSPRAAAGQLLHRSPRASGVHNGPGLLATHLAEDIAGLWDNLANHLKGGVLDHSPQGLGSMSRRQHPTDLQSDWHGSTRSTRSTDSASSQIDNFPWL